MKVLKWIVIVLLALVAVVLIFSATQPNQIIVEKSIVINASQEQVYNEVIDFKTWGNWSVWNQMDTAMQNEYSETMGEVGSFSSWKSTVVGNGEQKIVELMQNEYIKTEMKFEGWDGVNESEFFFIDNEGGTEVKWTFLGSETPFYMNLMNTFMKVMLEENYTKSLENLKAHIESMPAPVEVENPMGFEVMEVNAQPIISILDSTDADGIGKKLAELYTALSIYAATENIEIIDHPLAIYHKYSPELVILEAAMPTAAVEKGDGHVLGKELPAGKVVKGVFYGDNEASGSMHDAIYKYIGDNGFEMKEFCWEVYTNDAAEVDSAAVETQIYYPIQ